MARTAAFAFDTQIDAIVDAAMGLTGISDQLESLDEMVSFGTVDLLEEPALPKLRPARALGTRLVVGA